MRVKATRIVPGQHFGRLTALSESPERSTGKNIQWDCRCDCGVGLLVVASNLRNGHTTSCGCLRRERSNAASRTHGLSKKIPEYTTWRNMRQRCTDPKHPGYPDYGARGIVVSPEWDSFERFYADMGSKPSPSHTIERIDNEAGYGPNNCRWATRIEQNRNRRNNRLLTHAGRTMTLVEWAQETGINRTTLSNRLGRAGWSVERALTEYPQH